jgi:acetylglutamate kinase
MKKLYVIKIGGNIIDDQQQLFAFIQKFSAIQGAKILVHGGGKSATRLANTLGIPQKIVEGRRITDAATLDVAVMLYAGLINKTIVSRLQGHQCNSMGFCGADGNIIQSKKRVHPEIDFGFVGDISPDGIRAGYLEQCLDQGIIPVISPITHDGEGHLLNTNADHIASAVAIAMGTYFNVSLTYCFEKKGVLTDPDHEGSYLKKMSRIDYLDLSSRGIISNGMIPKLDNAFKALENGACSVNICMAGDISGEASIYKGTVLK